MKDDRKNVGRVESVKDKAFGDSSILFGSYCACGNRNHLRVQEESTLNTLILRCDTCDQLYIYQLEKSGKRVMTLVEDRTGSSDDYFNLRN